MAAEIKEKNPNLSPAEINARATKDYLNLSGRFSGAEKLDLARDAENVKFQARVDKALEINVPYMKAMKKGDFAEMSRIRQGVATELSNTAPAAAPAAAPAPAAPQAAAPAPVKVTSQEQFAKLPKGTTFVAPDGSIRIKP